MDYGIRNTIVLAISLILILGGGYLFLHYRYASELVDLESEIEEKELILQEYSQTATLYSEVLMDFAMQTYIQKHHPKELFDNHKKGRIYDYLRRLNKGISFTEFNYALLDSVAADEYGYVIISIRGEAEYRNLYNFVHRIERSSALVHIGSINITNMNELGKLSRVNFEMELRMYYNRDELLDHKARLVLAPSPGYIRHNPFTPHIQPIPPNTENLVDVDRSFLIGITPKFIVVRDQNGRTVRLRLGEEVYLGSLEQINTERKSALFTLNRGGIADQVMLTLKQDEIN